MNHNLKGDDAKGSFNLLKKIRQATEGIVLKRVFSKLLIKFRFRNVCTAGFTELNTVEDEVDKSPTVLRSELL